MSVAEDTTYPTTRNEEIRSWFTHPGPTESFLRTAPRHLVENFAETAPPVQSDPSWFTAVGPTPGFTPYR